MNARSIGRAVSAFFAGVGMFAATMIALGILSSLFNFHRSWGAPGYFWVETIKLLVVCTAGASVAAFFGSARYRGLGLTWGMLFGAFGGGIVLLAGFSNYQGGPAVGARFLAILPLAAAVVVGLWAEKLFRDEPEGDLDHRPELGRALEERLTALETRIRGLEELPDTIRRLEARLSGLSERPAAASAPTPSAPAAAPPPPPPAPKRPAPLSQPAAVRSALPKPAVPPPSASAMDDLTEGRWLFRVGMAIFLLGVSFFLKFAFDNQWIGPTGRVVMGFITGASFIAFGDGLQRRGAALYGQTLIGGGLGILYLSIFGAFHFYGLIEQLPAFGAMALVTLTAVVLALRYASLSVIVIAMAGGFATPALLSTGVVREVPLFAYLALLASGTLAVSTFRNWRWLNLLAFALVQLWLQNYFVGDYHPDKLGPMFGVTTLFFALFLVPSWRFNIRGALPSDAPDLILLLGNAALYYGTAYYSLLEKSPWEPWEAHLAVVVGAVYFTLAWATFARGLDDRRLLLCEMGLASAFAAIAIPIAWKWQWITIGWAVEALVLVWIGLRLKEAPMRWAGRGLMLLAGLRAAFYDQTLREAYQPFLNVRSLSFLTVLGLMALAIRMLHGRETEQSADERAASGMLPIGWNLLALYWLCCEAQDFLRNVYVPRHPSASLTHYVTVAYSVIWTLYASALMGAGLAASRRSLRLGAQVLFGATALKVIVVDLAELPLGSRVVSFLVLGGLILLVSYFLQRRRGGEVEA